MIISGSTSLFYCSEWGVPGNSYKCKYWIANRLLGILFEEGYVCALYVQVRIDHTPFSSVILPSSDDLVKIPIIWKEELSTFKISLLITGLFYLIDGNDFLNRTEASANVHLTKWSFINLNKIYLLKWSKSLVFCGNFCFGPCQSFFL